MSSPVYTLFGPTSIFGFAMTRIASHRVRPIVTSRRVDPRGAHWPAFQPERDADIARLDFGGTDGVIYGHAVCDVPNCESNPLWAHEKNVGNLRRILERIPSGMRFVYVSSDHVFGHDGRYDEDALPCPISAYGRTRVKAERLVLNRANSLVLRAPLSIGPSINSRAGHIDWLRYRITQGLPVTIVGDEARSAVLADDLATRIIDLADSEITGLRHAAAPLVDRVTIARTLCDHLGVPHSFDIRSRGEQGAPHMGRVEIATHDSDPLSSPLASILDRLDALSPAPEPKPA